MNDWYWILILVYFVVSALGGAASKKMKKAAAESRRAQSGGARPLDSGEPAATVRGEGARSPAEIAAEIRRVMGLEPEQPPQVEILEEEVVEDEEFQPAPQPVPQPSEHVVDHGGNLRQRMASQTGGPGTLVGRSLARLRSSGIEQRHPGSATVGSLRRPSGRRQVGLSNRSGLLDLSNLTRAFITLEALGPPRAFRDLDSTS